MKIEQYGEVITPFWDKVEVMSCDDDFEKARVSAITSEELKQRMYQRIDEWPWKEK